MNSLHHTASILDGRSLALDIRRHIKKQIDAASSTHKPGLAVILIGKDPASQIYVRCKEKACLAVGIESQLHLFSEDVSEQIVQERIHILNEDVTVHGILLQLPLPSHLHALNLIESIASNKDVDGLHPEHMGRLLLQEPRLRPCTPWGIMQLMWHYGISCKGRHAVVVGSSNIVGRPMALELLLAGATVTICHRHTKNLMEHVRSAEILVVATGTQKAIHSEWIQDGAVVVDVGIHHLPDGRIVGDVDFEIAQQRAAWITPVPGGVGPMTVATLLHNTCQAAGIVQSAPNDQIVSGFMSRIDDQR